MQLNYKFYLLTVLMTFGFLAPASAQGWNARIEGNELSPETIIAVDKEKQKTHLLIHRSPLKAEMSFVCTTGKADGDKLVEGDMKTPEGVYFTRRKRTGLTDYELYGEMAFPLDFPNPVDRIKGKTGYGIWVHGRGKELVPKDTQGCVALANADIGKLDERIRPGFPVVIGETVKWEQGSDNQAVEVEKIRSLVLEWAGKWADRSPDFFEFYDPKRFSVAQDKFFRSFRQRKERIFGDTPWIDVEVFDLKALHGPDYWVTWFNQYYRSATFSSASGKRLYWQKVDGAWKIVGVEYGPTPQGLMKRYIERKRPGIETFVENWRDSWLDADIDEYLSFYDGSARQSGRRGVNAIRSHKQSLWKDKSPAEIELGEAEIEECPGGFRVRFRQDYSDSSGYSDSGLKILVLRPEDDKWRITEEQWSRLK